MSDTKLPVPKATEGEPQRPQGSGTAFPTLARARGLEEILGTNRPAGAQRGDIIGGRYRVEGQIGRGGMGRVLRVAHTELEKKFAIKLPKGGVGAKDELRNRFAEEAKRASAMNHENLCSVFDFGEDERFGLFMVMELILGVRLDHKVRHSKGLSPKAACDVLLQLATALDYVHTRGVIHGDIKGENVLLTGGRQRVAKLIDFGLARGQGEAGHHGGTPHYLSPERIRGEPPTVASDIYALGILFFEITTGRLPFHGTTTEVLAMQAQTPLPRMSDYLARPIEERAEQLAQRATDKDPDKRHPDMKRFLYELAALMEMQGQARVRRRSAATSEYSPLLGLPTDTGSVSLADLPLPVAIVDAYGQTIITNPAFMAFVGATVEPFSLGLTPLAEVYPTIVDDISLVAADGTALRRVIDVTNTSPATKIMIWLTPSQRGVTVMVHSYAGNAAYDSE